MLKMDHSDQYKHLRFSESVFRQVVENGDECIWIMNLAHQTTYANRKMTKFLGCDEAEIIGRSLDEIFPKADLECVRNAIVEAALGAIEKVETIPVVDGHTGETRWADGVFAPLFSESNEVLGVIATLHDVTEQKRLLEEKNYKKRHVDNNQKILLELSKTTRKDIDQAYGLITEKLAEVIGTERTSIWLFNEDRTAIICCDLFTRSLHQHSRGMMLFTDEFPVYFTALEHARCIAAADAVTDTRTSEFKDLYLGQLKIVSMLDTPVRHDGKLAGLICCESVGARKEWSLEDQEFSSSVADILSTLIRTHQLRQTEKALEHSQEKYRQIVDNAVIGIYRSNISGQLLFVNQAMVELLEFDNVVAAMSSNIETFYPNTVIRKEFLTLLIKEHVLRNYELALVTARGNKRVVLVNAYYEEGMILGMMMDITDRKSAEEEILISHERASESDRLKTSLMANMSHEFRTPMNAILGFSDLIASDSQDPEIVFFARKIHVAGQRLMTTLKAILDLADLETTKSKLKIRKFNIHYSISNALQPFKPVANEKNLYLITEFKDNLAALYDENLLQIILHNLIDNAIKFTSDGGVTIETDHAIREGMNWVLIRIKDTGIGIPTEHFELIFHEFRQISEGYNRSYEGTGLGLTIARKMAEMLNGEISVESELNLGSIFTLCLPADTDPPDGMTKIELASNEGYAGKTFSIQKPDELPVILVVEDNDDNAEIVRLYLKGKYVIERAANAFSAIKMAAAFPYSAILMDINLGPGMDGLKAAQEIRKIENYREIPILAITGYTMLGDCEKLLSGGCSHYLGKPYSQKGLLDIMTHIFSRA